MAAAMQYPVVEPIEEVGYKMRPPLLEDVSVEGPLRIPIPHALDTLEQRDAIEEDYNWFRYSKFAAPWLIFMLLILLLIFISTAFQQVGSIRGLRDGTPRYYQLQQDSDLEWEGGEDKDQRNVRISAVVISIVGALLAFFFLAAKPRPKLRKALMIIAAIILLVGAVLGYISFGQHEADVDEAVRCTEFGIQQQTSNRVFNFISNEPCEDRIGLASAALALDFLMATAALIAAVLVVLYTFTGDFKLLRNGWREQERDLEQEPIKANKHNIKAHRVRRTRLILTTIALLATIAFAITLCAMLICLSLDRNEVHLMSSRGRSSVNFEVPPQFPPEEAGWPAHLTRLRYTWSAFGIMIILINLVPWRSRVLAYAFALAYFFVAAMALTSFGLDVDSMRDSRELGCPTVPYQNLVTDNIGGIDQAAILATRNTKVNCINSPYVSTVIWEFILVVAIIIYLLNEYVIRMRSVHSQRKYPWFQVRKIEQAQDSRRPIRCELTSQVMTAKEYYYKHRFLVGSGVASGFSASSYSDTLFAGPMAALPAPPIYA